MSVRSALAGLSLLLTLGTAAAGDLAAFNDAIETFSVHHRMAIAHLRAGKIDMANAEMANMSDAWGHIVERFGKNRPAEFTDNALYVTTFVDVPTRIVGADLMLMMRRPDLARAALVAIREQLSTMRRASGVEILADAILDANVVMVALGDFQDHPPEWTPATVAAIAAKTQAYGAAVRRCDEIAPQEVRQLQEFRRLVDGITAVLAAMSEAVAAHDDDRVGRLLDELQVFDRLLAFHYG